MARNRDRPLSHDHEQTDLALVEAARRDREVFGRLYDRHVDRVYGYAHRRLRDAELAEDATAVAFSRALHSLDRFRAHVDQADSGSSFIRWLMTIARNTVIDLIRERQNSVALDMDSLSQMRSSSGDDPATAIPPDDRLRVEQAIHDLGSPQQEIVVLRLQGWKGAEIAELLGMTHGAVRVAQHRAYTRLRTSLEHLHSRSSSSENGGSS